MQPGLTPSNRYLLIWALACAPASAFVGVQANTPDPPQAGESSQPDQDPEEISFLARWAQSRTLTGDWGGLRTELEDKGVRANVFLNDQYQGVISGGLDKNGFRNSASMDALITFDLDTLGIVQNADALLHLQSNWGSGINPRTGSSFQVNDDADGELGGHVAQLWYRHHFFDRRVSLMLGFLDYQTIVDRNRFANSEDKQFMHQALDNNPLIPLNIGLGASLSFRPTNWYTMILGVSDGQSVLYQPGFSTAFHDENWWFAYMEHGFRLELPSHHGPLEGNYRAGLFYDPRPHSIFIEPNRGRASRFEAHDYAFYFNLDQTLYRESKESQQGLGAFARFAYRTAATNHYARFYSAGLSYEGLLPGRDEDVLGLACAITDVSDDYRTKINRQAGTESVYELFYAVRVTPWIVVTPDIQYIDNPGANGNESHAVVTGIRTRISF